MKPKLVWTSELGKYIKASRDKKGWSQDKLASEVGLTQQYISDLELGKRNFSNDVLLLIAVSLDTYPSEYWLKFEHEVLPDIKKHLKEQE
ncbi:helix-turn-helix domain-containing protein [Anaerobacillus sp. CMMVII]|uniref:helix-turn-helix domain-containing protein n=1 Tax=Anaerobacillus sp. CMMVII TaxID=2755588 RepID=UPI0021B7E27A|nr:helix-turn-helix transcriptional regulator [Anaerobacillus sp. CMMVII]